MPVEVDYRFPPGVDATKQARVIAVGQTAGTWDARHVHREDALRAHLAEVVGVRALPDGAAVATVRFPDCDLEADIGGLLTLIFGKYSMAGPARVVGLRLPRGFGLRPRFGIAGIRARLSVYDRPLVMAIFKPALGLSADDHAGLLREVAEAGIDIVKDDEIHGDLASAPTLRRLEACRRVIDDVRARTGRTVLYAVKLSGRADQLQDQARRLVDAGANALLCNVLAHGYSVLEALAADPKVDVPLFAHPALAGALCGAPDHGLSYPVALGTLMVAGGADAVLYPAHYGSLPFDHGEEMEIRDTLRAGGAFPVPSAGIHPGVVPRALQDYGTDVVLNAGTGIMDHPDGPGEGVRAFFEALRTPTPWDRAHLPIALRRAVEKWGGP